LRRISSRFASFSSVEDDEFWIPGEVIESGVGTRIHLGAGAGENKIKRKEDPLRFTEKPPHTKHGMATDCRDGSPGRAFEG